MPETAGARAYHVFFDRSGLPDLESFIRFTPPTIGEVYDARGAVLIRLAREYRRVVTYDEVPPVLRHAILSAEDKHFFIHSGVDTAPCLECCRRNPRPLRSQQMAEWLQSVPSATTSHRVPRKADGCQVRVKRG